MSQKYISFVFDDGPDEIMCDMVDKIVSYGWKAGFAIIGEKINKETEKQLQYAIDYNFELVSHGWAHINLAELNDAKEIAEEIMKPIREIESRLQYNIKKARLPFLSHNDLVLKTITDLGIPLLGQGIDGGRDWLPTSSPELIANTVLNSVSDGAIACLHVTENTMNALDIILPELKKRNYTLVTAKELFEIKNIKQIPLGVNISNVNHI